MIFNYLSEGFALGLSTGLLCLTTCGPIYSPYLMQRGSGWVQSFVNLLKISFGRFLTYTLFGIVAGIIGKETSQISNYRDYFTAAAYIFFSIFLFISAFRTRWREKGCAVSRWGRFADSPFMLGVLTGINFCPSFLLALTRAVDLSGALSGAMVFIGFFFGTNIYLLPIGVFGVLANKKITRTISVISSLGVGIWFITQAGVSINRLVQEHNQLKADFENKSVVSVFDTTQAYILCTDTTSFLLLRDKLQQKRAGNIALVNDTADIGDKGYVFVDHGWPGKAGIASEQLKRPGIFVIILPEPEDTSYDENYAEKIIQYLDKYYFKLDKDHGSLFDMKRMLKGREKPVQQ